MAMLSIFLLGLSVALQGAAAVIAWRQMARAGRYRLAWGCVSLALLLMIARRGLSLAAALGGDIEDLDQTVVGLLISTLMLTGIHGLRLMFADLHRHEDALAQQAATDPLTGLANRRHAMELILTELQRASRTSSQCTLLMLDLDRFKEVNDRHGHAAGDTLLQSVAAVFRTVLRGADIVGRIGGEEFLILLVDTDAARAIQVAERLRAEIAKLRLSGQDGEAAITVSIGATTLEQPQCRDLAAAQALVAIAMRDADRLLYQSKGAGRNRVTASSLALPSASRR